MEPFISIGVTTYNRPDFLKNCLESIRAQTFGNFEVIIGNDYVVQPVTGELLGIQDSRFKFVNHEKNLGEHGNMNSLLGLARGRYFTWLADDDLYSPFFLEAIQSCIAIEREPPVVYASFAPFIEDARSIVATSMPEVKYKMVPSGRFVRDALTHGIRVIGTTGVFRRELLDSIGGYEDVSEHPAMRGLYGEYMLFLRIGAFADHVPLVPAPLVYFRAHATSFSYSDKNLDLRRQAGIRLVKKASNLVAGVRLRPWSDDIMCALMKIALGGVAESSLHSPNYAEWRLPRDLLRMRLDWRTSSPELHPLMRRSFFKAFVGTMGDFAWPITAGAAKRIAPSFALSLWRRIRKRLVS